MRCFEIQFRLFWASPHSVSQAETSPMTGTKVQIMINYVFVPDCFVEDITRFKRHLKLQEELSLRL